MTPGAALDYDHALWVKAFELAYTDPLALTEAHFEQLLIADPAVEARAREQQRLAQLKTFEARTTALAEPPLRVKTAMEVAGEFVEPIVGAFSKQRRRIDALEQRLAALERAPSVKFKGVWAREQSYQPGDACTLHGGLWVCRQATTGEPGVDFVAWTLAVKRGSR